MQWVQCHICLTKKPKRLSHLHHKEAQAAGGGNERENLCYLCSECHNTLHRLGEIIQSGKNGLAEDLAMTQFPAPAARTRLLQLARTSAESFLDPQNASVRVRVQLSLPRELLKRVKLMVSEKKENGKKLSMNRYIELLLEAELARNGKLY